MEILNVETFKEKIYNFEESPEWKYKGTKPAIIDFYADWCGPCHMLSPILEDVANQYAGRVEIYKINTEASPELSHLFGIKGIPALLFAPVGHEEPALTSGVMPKESFETAIKELFGIDP